MSEYFTRPNIPKVIGTLGNTPEQRGLSTQEFKNKFDEMPENIQRYLIDTLLPELDAHQAESSQQFSDIDNVLEHYNVPQAAPYESGDNRWRDISGIGFYYAGTGDIGYPAAGILIHFKLEVTGITWQMFLGTAGNVYTRRVTGGANFADAAWTQV